MSGTIGIIIFAVLALFSIGLHEFGHFSTARLFKMKVDRFFIGFGPALWSVKRGETEYGVAALPLGGYVRIAGMNPYEEIPEEDRDRVFKAKKPWQRAIVLAAGSTTHFILGFLIMVVVLAITPAFGDPTLELAQVSEEIDGRATPAAAAGLREGDVITAIDGEPVASWSEAVELIRTRPGEEVTITVRRGDRTVPLRTELWETTPEGARQGFLGVSPDYERIDRSFLTAVTDSGRWIGQTMWGSLVAFRQIFSPETFGRIFEVISGNAQRTAEDPATIIGIGKSAGDLARSGAWDQLFMLVAGFNVFIGVANLVPLPPLDGGHLAVLAYEKIRGRDVDMRKLLPITAAVISVFATLFFLLLYLDIVNPIPTPS